MNGSLAQLIALVAHGSSFLSGSAGNEALGLGRSSSTFQYVGSLSFARYSDKQASHGTEVAVTTEAWFETLRREGAKRLWYVAFAWSREDLPEHIAGSFAGGVSRAIQVDYPTGYELWYPAWTVANKDEPIRRPWHVEYRSLRSDRSQARTPEVEAVKSYLRQKLEAAQRFAASNAEAATWGLWFTKALQLLASEAPQPPFHADMIPLDGYSVSSRQLLAAATQANVFGGMGSWNDMGFTEKPTQAEYEQVTRELYEAVKVSFVAAVNSFDEKLVIQEK